MIGIDPSQLNAAIASLHSGEQLDDLECSRMQIISNIALYRFTSDSVRLANLVKGSYKSQLMDLCSGSGIIPMLIAAKTNIKSLIGVELQSELCDMARRSSELNGLSGRISYLNCDINELSSHVANHSYDIVTCNPPYYRVNSGESRLSPSVAMARHELTVTLSQVIATASLMLKYGGNLYLVHKCDRLAETISELRQHNLEPKQLYLYSPTASHACDTFIVIAKSYASIGMTVHHITIDT